ncbi:hypothetical protein [Myxococcus sp. NMCA1]|uniref:hypothetical protein n=1 Tax=Myxococcus sp. NMCA1 TaxID=2996785 RepID=UPI002285CB0C|nr:hypothetical protein [Myxococcus sp. NMCA1]WAM24806.1 hypothetical protein OZ403_30360 [Myxococcus sp. NMCA1]
MKNFYLAVPLALAMTGCVDSPPDIQLFNAFIPDAACAVNQSGLASTGGSLDLTTSGRYLAAFQVRNSLSSQEVVVGDAPVTGGGDESSIYVTNVELNYETQGTGPTLTNDVYPNYFNLPANATQSSSVVLDLLGANAREDLAAYFGGGGTNAVGVIVRLKLIGKTINGKSTESNEITYPITFYYSGFTCPVGTQLEANGPCGLPGGQDRFAPECTEPEET